MISSRRYADAFVDDTSIGFNDPNNLMNVPSLIRTLTECAQLCWENLFFSTGGALELSKCYYHILHWHWDVLGYPKITTLNPHLTDPGEYSSSTDTFNSLKLISERETHYTKIHHKAPHISSKSLGVISCALGSWDDKFKRLPQQPKPMLQQEDNWKEAITKHLITQGSKKHLRLRQPLGRWTGTPTSHWQYYYDQTTKGLWKYQEIDAKVWTVYENEPVMGAPRFNLSKGTPSTVGPPKDHCAPCDVSPWGSITFRSCVMTSKPAQATSPRTFREHVKGLDTTTPHKQRLLRNLTLTNMMEARLCRHLLVLGLP